MKKTDKCLIARCKVCNRVIFAAVNELRVIEDAQEEIIELIYEGYDLVHVSHDDVRSNFGCS